MYKHVKKSVKRALSLALVLMVILLNASPAFAATDNAVSKEPSLSKAISFSGKDASPALVQSLQKHGVTVDENTLLAVRPSGTGTGATELRVTQKEGNLVTDSVFTAFDENGEQLSVPVVATDPPGTNGGKVQDIDFFSDGSLIFHVAVHYWIYDDDSSFYMFVQPRALIFYYYNTGSHVVDYAYVAYVCEGFEHYYPGFESVYPSNVFRTYAHTILIEEDNPEKNYQYFESDPYRSDRALEVSSYWAGHGIDYTFGVNGTDFHSSIDFRGF